MSVFYGWKLLCLPNVIQVSHLLPHEMAIRKKGYPNLFHRKFDRNCQRIFQKLPCRDLVFRCLGFMVEKTAPYRCTIKHSTLASGVRPWHPCLPRSLCPWPHLVSLLALGWPHWHSKPSTSVALRASILCVDRWLHSNAAGQPGSLTNRNTTTNKQ